MYNCKNCTYGTENKSNYQKHIDKKVCEGKKYTCPECGKKYVDKSTLNKHCKTIHSSVENPQVKIGSGSMDVNSNVSGSEVINTNIKGNNNIVIIVNPVGRENLDFMTDEYFISFMSYLTQEDSNGLIKIMTDIHYDQNRPENHNICVTDLRRKKILFKTTSEGVNNVVEGINAKSFVIRFMVKPLKTTY
jgi:Zinc finger, C2H2 type